MAYGTANVDVIQSSTANVPVQFNDGNGTQVGTLCRAWVNFNGTNGSIRAAFNVSSVTRVGSGNYTVNFTNAMADANYSPQVNNQAFGTGFGSSTNVFSTGYNTNAAPSTSSFSVCTYRTATGAVDDSAYVLVNVFR